MSAKTYLLQVLEDRTVCKQSTGKPFLLPGGDVKHPRYTEMAQRRQRGYPCKYGDMYIRLWNQVADPSGI